MKRARVHRQSTDADECTAFSCSLGSCSGEFCITVQVPGQVVASTPVLAELAQLEGSSAIQQSPQSVLAWLAWRAHHHGQSEGRSQQWDPQADAFDVCSRVLLYYPIPHLRRLMLSACAVPSMTGCFCSPTAHALAGGAIPAVQPGNPDPSTHACGQTDRAHLFTTAQRGARSVFFCVLGRESHR